MGVDFSLEFFKIQQERKRVLQNPATRIEITWERAMEAIKTKWAALTGKKTDNEEEEPETKKGVGKARLALMMATVGAAAFAGPALLAPKLNDELWWEEEVRVWCL